MASFGFGSGPNPFAILEHINAYQRTACLRAAVELELFTAIQEGAQTVDTLARRCSASARGIRILCDFLAVQGLLTKGDGHYGLAPESAVFLVKSSPVYLGGVLGFLNSPELMSAFDNVAEVVRRGTTLQEGAGVVKPEDPIWIEFAKSMVPVAARTAEWIAGQAAGAGPQRVLDIAAGHGMFGIAIARRNPQAQITPVDWQPVLELATANARSAGVADRYHPLAGDAFQVEFGSGHDVVLLTNFLHHFDAASCVTLLRKIRASMAPGGRLFTLEFVPNPDRVSPPQPAMFSLMMLCNTPAGDAYTFEELKAMLAAAGFERTGIEPVPLSTESLLTSS
jgi:ubiquinone/menaquinone biosynthesis C-methylase UbiE